MFLIWKLKNFLNFKIVFLEKHEINNSMGFKKNKVLKKVF